jgi:hypothetical protein
LGTISGNIVEIPNEQAPQSAYDIVSFIFLEQSITLPWQLSNLNARDFFDPENNTESLRKWKARYKTYLLRAPYMLKKDSFVLLWAVVLWAPQNLKGILEVNSIVCEKRWLDQEHVGRLLDMYKRATWEIASIDAVKNVYSALRQHLHGAHQNEDEELTSPNAFGHAVSGDEDDDLQIVKGGDDAEDVEYIDDDDNVEEMEYIDFDKEYVGEEEYVLYYNPGGSRVIEDEDDDCQIIERPPLGVDRQTGPEDLESVFRT